MIVADFVPDYLKFWALTHDQAEALTSDIASPYKNAEFKATEDKLLEEMYHHQGVRPPTKQERQIIKNSDCRSRQGEIHSGIGDVSLAHQYPVPDLEAQRLTLKYHRKYQPSDTIRANGKAVAEFVRRFHQYRALIRKDS